MLTATFISDVPPTKPDAKIKVDLIKDQNGRVLIATTGGVISQAQNTLVKQAMPLIEQAVFKDMGINVYVQGNSLIMEQKVNVYDPRTDPDFQYPGFRKHVKAVIREMIQSGELTR